MDSLLGDDDKEWINNNVKEVSMPDMTVTEAKEALGVKDDEVDWEKGEKVETGGSFEGETWDFNTQQTVKGTYIGKKTGVKTKFGERTIYYLQDGETLWNIWEAKQIVDAFSKFEEGDRIKITYAGKVQTNRGNQVKTFEFIRVKKDVK